MTAGNNGTGTPDNDDPFAYLYRPENGADGSADGSTAKQPGVPRTSYNHVRAVGQRQYGSSAAQQGPSIPQQQGYRNQPSPHYAAPETQPGGRQAARQHGGAGHAGGGRGRRPGGQKPNGLLIGAIAVVAAVVLGVGAAMLFSKEDPQGQDGGPEGSAAPAADAGQDENDGRGDGRAGNGGAPRKDKSPAGLPREDAALFNLGGSALVAGDVPGAKADGGKYVAGMNALGSSVTWNTEIKEAGQYRLYVGYGVPGKDMHLTVWVNGARQQDPLNMANFAGASEGDWAKGWTRTWALVDAKAGANSFKLSCEEGNNCEVLLDQAWIAKG